MADIISDHDFSGDSPKQSEPYELVELLFFAYRDFTSDPDALLAADGFGRAHHRVIHFVARNPGLRVADLLDILKITKQSLARVLRQLVDEGFIEQRKGDTDRRERRLFVTEKGKRLSVALSEPQIERITAALDGVSPDAFDTICKFLLLMVNEEERQRVATLVRGK
ncbi:MAG: MarR family transcriptional regulator [Pseudomonadota bacterium]